MRRLKTHDTIVPGSICVHGRVAVTVAMVIPAHADAAKRV